MATTQTTETTPVTGERADLLAALTQHRYFLRHTVRGLTEEQAASRPTVSELCLGGLIKHVAGTEQHWADFMVNGAPSGDAFDPDRMADWAAAFRMSPEDTLEGVLAQYQAVADRTDQLVRDLPDLGVSHALPEAPWFEPGATWSVRRVLMHIIAETAQHAGHADILRESIDGAKSMG